MLPISDYQKAKTERDAKIYAEYNRLVGLKTPSASAVKHIQANSAKICGTQLHAFETIYRIIRKFKKEEEKLFKKSRSHQLS